jgi:hypothetical protein
MQTLKNEGKSTVSLSNKGSSTIVPFLKIVNHLFFALSNDMSAVLQFCRKQKDGGDRSRKCFPFNER